MSDFQLFALTMTLITIAFVIAYVALFHDWASRLGRRTPRCPKCLHDLDPTGGLRCPECGTTARSERATRKSRRRWKLTLLVPIFLCAAWYTAHGKVVAEHGWAAAVPTSILVYSAAPYVPSTAPGKTAAERMAFELRRRATDDDLRPWQWKIWIDRAIRSLEGEGHDRRLGKTMLVLADALGKLTAEDYARADAATRLVWNLRRNWPTDAAIIGKVAAVRHWRDAAPSYTVIERRTGRTLMTHNWTGERMLYGGTSPTRWNDHLQLLATVPPVGDGIDVTVQLEFHDVNQTGEFGTVPPYDETLPVVVSGTATDHVEPMRSAEIEGFLSGIGVYLHHYMPPALAFSFDALDPVFDDAQLDILALRIEVLHEGNVIATAHAWGDVGRLTNRSLTRPRLNMSASFIPLELHVSRETFTAADALTVRLTGDATTALRCSDATRFWDGTVTVPIQARVKDLPDD